LKRYHKTLKQNFFQTGILTWEIFTLGQLPYPGFEANEHLYNKLKEGYRMDKPDFATQTIYDVMLDCWKKEPDTRPVR
jgi:FMS-like tyrosine kinase 1